MATSDDSRVGRQSSSNVSDAPHPDDPRKPQTPSDLGKPAWKFALKRAFAEFSDDECTDLAAALTYYSVLSLFPAAIAVISLLGVFGQGPSTINALLQIAKDLGAGSVTSSIEGPLQQLSQNQKAGLGLVIGLLTALWSASGYVGAFGRAMNRIYEIGEGRPFYKLRPVQILITLIAVILISAVAISLVVSGPLAAAIGNAIGLSSTLVTVWNIVKWPVLAAIVVLIIAILYYATPNVKQPKFRWMSLGAFTALVVWVIASALFGFYVANFGSYNKTYGTLAGVIVFLLWLWITNLALLFGAEVDSEIERSRQLQAGIPAEDDLQLPARDDKGLRKKAEKEEKAREEARELRQSAE
jgi:membrane protein